MEYIEKLIKSERIYDGKILKLKCDTVELTDGSVSKREIVEHSGGCAILAIDADGYIYLTKQFRYAYNGTITEIPAGKLESGEDPLVCARRELMEETGIIADKIEEFGVIYPSTGYTNEIIRLFLATGIKRGEATPDEGELIDCEKVKLTDALTDILNGEIKDAKTVTAVLKYCVKNNIFIKN